jgi:hypothetical protein
MCAPSQAEAINKAGLVTVPILEDIDMMRFERLARYAAAVNSPGEVTDGLPLLHPITGRPVTDLREYDVEANMAAFWAECGRTNDRNRDAAVAFARAWPPSLVVHDLMSLEGVLAARATGVPAVYHSPGMFGARETGLDDTTGAFARHGLPAWDRSHVEYVIDPTPPDLAPEMDGALRIPVRHVPYNGPGALEPWMLERPARPRVCLLWSNSVLQIFGPHVPSLRHVIDSVTARGAELVLTASPEQVGALGELPGSVRVLSDFPVHLLLETSDAIVHQGAGNAIMNGAVAGLPQLMLATTDDQLEMGKRYAKAGASVWLPGLTAAYEQVDEAVARLLGDPGMRTAARRIRSGIATRPPAAALVEPLERLARTGRLDRADLPGGPARPAASASTR